METDRRKFISGMASACLIPLAGQSKEYKKNLLISSLKGSKSYSVAILTFDGEVVFSKELEGRGHDISISPNGSLAVVFARRPGYFANVIDLENFRVLETIRPKEGRNFYGHGAFSSDGKLLFAAENDFENEKGVIGIYDSKRKFCRVGEFRSFGKGPHQIILRKDNRTLVVANGGIITHPDLPRAKLNLSSMDPSLVYIDIRTGELLEKVRLPTDYRRLSIRHLSEAYDGSIWFGAQYEGPPEDEIDLVGKHFFGNEIKLINLPNGLYKGLRQYIGSVSSSPDGKLIATSSPKGNKAIIWDTISTRVVGVKNIKDVGGIAPQSDSDFYFSSGNGSLISKEKLIFFDSQIKWDNHLASNI
mgnify:FL=1